MKIDPKQIVQDALTRNELAELLLGRTPYNYQPPHSASPYQTDLIGLLEILYQTTSMSNLKSVATKLQQAVLQVSKTYEGVIPTALVILIETLRLKRGHVVFSLPLDQLALELRNTVTQHQEQLKKDFSNGGSVWPDGILGEIRRLNQNITEIGGPAFLEED